MLSAITVVAAPITLPNATEAAVKFEPLPFETAAAPPSRRRLLFVRGKGRGGKGRGKGSGGMAAAGEPQPPLPATRPPATERVCYPTPPNEARQKQGQVLEGTSFGAALSAIAALPSVSRVLELGTWYGGGSTVNLGKGIRDSARATLAKSLGASASSDNCVAQGAETCCHSLVVTVEVFEPAWEHARRYLRDLPVWSVRGSTVAAEEMLQISQIPMRLRDQHFKLYYNRDLKLMQRSTPQLRRFCAVYHFDLVLIDGNEYTGWAEFNRVRTECKPTYLALHDTQTLKTQKIEEYLNKNSDEYQLFLRKYATQSMRPACELVGCKTEQQFIPNSAGWSIYKRVDGADAAAAAGGGGSAAAAAVAPQPDGATAVLDEATNKVVAKAPSGKLGRRLRRKAAKAAKVAADEKEEAGDEGSAQETWGEWLKRKTEPLRGMLPKVGGSA